MALITDALAFGMPSLVSYLLNVVTPTPLLSAKSLTIREKHPVRKNYAERRLEIRNKCNEISSKLE